MLAALIALAMLAVALLGAAPAEANSSGAELARDARSLHPGAGTTVAGHHPARHRKRGLAGRRAVDRKPWHDAKSKPGGVPAGSPPITAPGAPLIPALAEPPAATPATGDGRTPLPGAAPAPPAQRGVDQEPPAEEPESPPAEEPKSPPAEEPESPPAEEPKQPPAEEPKQPPAEEPEQPGPGEPESPGPGEPETPPEDPDDPPPPAAGLLFRGDTIRDFNEKQAAPGAITEVPDPLGSGATVFKMTVDDDDVAPVTPTENPRAQLISPDLVEPGDEFWLKAKFLIPADFPTVTGWLSLLSVYGPPFNASSPWQIEVIGDQLQWTRNRTYGFDVPWQAPLTKGSWVTVLTHERFAADGFIEMWINGQPVSFFGRETRLAMKTMDSSNDGGTNSVRISQYRQAGMFETATVYWGPVLLGTTRAAVGG